MINPHNPSRSRPSLQGVFLVIGLFTVANVPAQEPVASPPPDVQTEWTALPQKLDLNTALALARSYNYPVNIAMEQVEEAKYRTGEFQGQRGPQLSLEGSAGAVDQGLIEGFGEQFQPQTETWRGGLQVVQPLYQGGALSAQVRGQQRLEEAAGESLRGTRYDAMLFTAEAFFGAMLARDQIGVQEESVRLFEQQLALASNRFAAGSGSQFDVLQADVSLRNAKPPLVRARSQYRVAIDALRQIIGLPYPEGLSAEDIELIGEWPFPRIDYSLDDALRTAVLNRSELAALDFQRQAGEERVRAARGQRLPQVNASGGYVYQSRQFGDGFSDTLDGWEVGLQAAFPIFSSGLLKERQRQAESQLRQIDLAFRQQEEAVEVDVRRAYSDWQVALEILDTSNAVIRQAEEALRLADNRYRVGAITQLDVLQSQLGLTRARLERAQASHDYNLAAARLNRAMGILVAGERLEVE